MLPVLRMVWASVLAAIAIIPTITALTGALMTIALGTTAVTTIVDLMMITAVIVTIIESMSTTVNGTIVLAIDHRLLHPRAVIAVAVADRQIRRLVLMIVWVTTATILGIRGVHQQVVVNASVRGVITSAIRAKYQLGGSSTIWHR